MGSSASAQEGMGGLEARGPDRLPNGFVLLQVTPRLDGGGVEEVTVQIARAVGAAGARSLVASRGGAMEDRLGEARLIRLPVHARDPARILANAARLAALIRREGVSLVHVRSRAPAFSALMAGRVTHTPVIATYHGIYSARSAFKRWYNSVMTRGAAVMANSRFTRDHILAEHRVDPARIVVIPEGVDTEAFDPAAVCADRIAAVRQGWGMAPDDHRPVILQAARLTGWKGQGLAIAALAAMARRDARLVLAGRAQSPQAKQALQAAAADAGVADRVDFAGEANDMPAAFLAADLVIAPTTAAESFGRSVAEAAAMERLVLASDLGAVRETLGEGRCGRLVAPGDPLAWARAMDQALDLAEPARRAIGVAARARMVQEYSLGAMSARTFALYARILEGRA